MTEQKNFIDSKIYMGVSNFEEYNRLHEDQKLLFLNRGDENKIFNVIKSQQFSRVKIDYLIQVALAIRKLYKDPTLEGRKFLKTILEGRSILCYFEEPSSRTKHSFVRSVQMLGGDVSVEQDIKKGSSMAKGETYEDTIRNHAQYFDLMIIRHSLNEALEKSVVALNSILSGNIPIINAGSGNAQHPTQALLDLLTIFDELGRLDGLKVMMVGDLLNGRTVTSLAYILGRLCKDTEIYFVSPEELKINHELKDYLMDNNVRFYEMKEMNRKLKEADVVYMTRVQKERFIDQSVYEGLKDYYVFINEHLNEMKEGSILMHPLPRVYELNVEEHDDPKKVAIWRQVENGKYMRASLIVTIFGQSERILERDK